MATQDCFVPGARVTKKVPAGRSQIVRETFSLPPGESALLDQVRHRAAAAGVMVNRSEVVRAGIAALSALSDKALAAAVNRVPKVKTGRASS